MRTVPKFLLSFLCISLGLLACKPKEKPTTSGPLKVVATTGMLGDMLRQIGAPHVEVQTLMGPGVDPHLYKATQGDLKALQAADAIVYNGLHLEGKMVDILAKLGERRTVLAVAESLPEDKLIGSEAFSGTHDPHIWFDVALWQQCIKPVAQMLAKLDSQHAGHFQQQAKHYSDSLEQLHKWVQAQVAKLPTEKRIMVTAHDAFSYFGQAYGFTVKGLQGISTLSEFGLKDRVNLVNYIVEKEIPAVFIESSVSAKNIQAIIEGCQQRGHDVQLGGTLYSDALGPASSPAGEYIGMVKHNVNTLISALQ